MDGVFEVVEHYEFGDLPIGDDEAAMAPKLDNLLERTGHRILQGYNENSGYFLVRKLQEEP